MWTFAAGAIGPSEITIFLLSLGVLLGLARLLGELARKLRQPAVLGEILAGVLLGPTLLGAIAPDVYHWLFPQFLPTDGAGFDATYIGLTMVVTLSVVLLMLVAGFEVDVSTAWRQGKATLLVSLMGMVVPFIFGFALGWFVPHILGHDPSVDRLAFALFLGIALSITALPVIAKILMDLNMSKSDMGALIMSSAMVNDLVGWIGFALVLAMLHAGGGAVGGGDETAAAAIEAASGAQRLVEAIDEPIGEAVGVSPDAVNSTSATVGTTILLTIAFVGVMLTFGRWAAHRALPFVQANFAWPGGVIVFVLVSALFCAAFTEWIGIHAIFGAFIVGVVMGDSDHLTNRTRETIHEFVINIFAPLFFATIGLRLSFIESFDLVMVLVIFVVACAGKLIGCYIGARWAGIIKRESWAISFGMVGRGTMEIILGQLAYDAGLIGEELLVAIIIMALATSMMSGPGMQWLLKQKPPRQLGSVITSDGFIPNLRGSTRQEVIGELSAAAAKATGIDARQIHEAVWRRERILSTGLEHGIAVPHARMPNLAKPFIVIGLSDQGIDFDAIDGERAHIICMMLTPDTNQTAQIELLEMVARAFNTPAARHGARSASNFTQFKAALNVSAYEENADANANGNGSSNGNGNGNGNGNSSSTSAATNQSPTPRA